MKQRCRGVGAKSTAQTLINSCREERSDWEKKKKKECNKFIQNKVSIMEERHLRGAALYMNYNRVFSLISVGFL